jgi:hypothetical protein
MGPNPSLCQQRRSFYLRLIQKAVSRSELTQYELVHVLGYLSVPQRPTPGPSTPSRTRSRSRGIYYYYYYYCSSSSSSSSSSSCISGGGSGSGSTFFYWTGQSVAFLSKENFWASEAFLNKSVGITDILNLFLFITSAVVLQSVK